MNTVEKNLAVKNAVVACALGLPEDAIQIGDFMWAVPVVIDGEDRWGRITVTSTNNKATKTNPSFDAEAAHDEWLAEKAEKERVAKEKAAKKNA